MLANLAIFGAGGVAVPIYASSTDQEVEHILKDSGARAVFYDHNRPQGRLPGKRSRLEQLKQHLPDLEHLIGFDSTGDLGGDAVSLSELEARGDLTANPNPFMLEERAEQIAADDLAHIFYTSGTTGRPKGVMLTHRNWTYQAWAIQKVHLLAGNDTVLLFLPLAHVFAMVNAAAWLGQGFVLAFAESVETAVDDAAEVQATVTTAVPRFFEKAFNRVISDGSSQPGIKGRLFNWALGQFDAYAASRAAGREHDSLQWALAKRLVFKVLEQKLAKRFGGHMRHFVSGGAPLASKIAYFFEACGQTICEGYGLTETSAPTHCNRPGSIRVGTVGPAFPQVDVKIADDGEILIRGPQVMKGYYHLPQETAAVLDPEGWLRTGDIGELDPNGYLRITDRKKDLIKTSGGKYIAPQELENAIKTDPLVSQAVIHGDRRKFVTALVAISPEQAAAWAEKNGITYQSFPELTRRPELIARLQKTIDAVNLTQPSYAVVKKFTVLDHDWSQETGELTPTLKVKRKVVTEKYKELLDRMYDGETYG
jgi:long-chain acyl-CoA synthetase